MDINQLREAVQKNLEERKGKQSEEDEARSEMEKITTTVEERGAAKPNDDETKTYAEARDKRAKAKEALAKLDADRAELEQRIEDIEASETARKAAEESAKKYGGDGTPAVRVGAEEPVYRKDRPERSFFRDMYNYRVGADPGAADRIIRHQRQAESEMRDASSDAFAGLVIPQFLVEDFAPVARQGRPFANFIGSRDLPPDGMTLNVPRGDTGTLVLSQTSQNNAVAEQDVANTDIVVPVVTIAGQHDMSRQSVDRGRNTDDEVMADLAEAYTAELDRQTLNGSGANNQHFGVLSTTGIGTVTVVSVTGVTQVRKVAEAISSVHGSRFMPATVIVVHPRRWAYWSQSVDDNNRPLVTPRANGPQNTFGVGDLVSASGIVGDLYGLPVMTDANIPTTLSFDVTAGATTDPVIVTRATDLRLYENDPLPRRVRFEETLAGNLTVKIVAYDYSAFTAARYTSGTVVLTGSGLTTPTFG